MGILVGTYTNVGSRPVNEDYVTYREAGDSVLVVVADGLGGHAKGEVASSHVGAFLHEAYRFGYPAKEELHCKLLEAQESLLELQKSQGAVKAMKTTVVALVVEKDKAWMAHVGDSRGYVFYKDGSYQRTLDHSVTQMLALAGEIQEKDIRYNEERSRLLRVLGSPWEKDAIEFEKEMDLKNIQAFLLCSDGFWELIDEEKMRETLNRAKTPQEWLEKMTKIVEKNGKGKEMDNYTAAAVFITKASPWWKFRKK